MTHLLNYPWLFGILFALLLAAVLEIGRRISMPSRLHGDAERKEQIVAIRDGLFVLISLLIGFTLSLAANRYFDRRSLASTRCHFHPDHIPSCRNPASNRIESILKRCSANTWLPAENSTSAYLAPTSRHKSIARHPKPTLD